MNLFDGEIDGKGLRSSREFCSIAAVVYAVLAHQVLLDFLRRWSKIPNMGIEILVRDRYELPSFSTILRESRAQRVSVNRELFLAIHDKLGLDARLYIDDLFVTNEEKRISPWNDLKKDTSKPTLAGLRDLIRRYDRLAGIDKHTTLLKDVPYVKIIQLSLEAQSLDAARMMEIAPPKRYALALALIRTRFARIRRA